MNRTRVVVMMGGPSSEHEVSLASGEMVFQALAGNPDFAVRALTIERDGRWQLTDAPRPATPQPRSGSGRIARHHVIEGIRLLAEADVAFLALHGAFGEDGTVQGLLEALDVAYTGSGPLASALAMNKAKAKELFRAHGLRVASEVRLAGQAREDIEDAVQRVQSQLRYPVVVKPNTGGSSVGIALAHNTQELTRALRTASRFDLEVLVEEKLWGREVTCAVLERLDGSLEALPVIEIVPKKGAFFDFASKYDDAGADEICPAPIGSAESREIQEAAMTAHRTLGCEGFSRTDMFLTASGPVVLEVNTIPGMTPNSLLPKAARAAGISFPELMSHLIKLALSRQARRWSIR